MPHAKRIEQKKAGIRRPRVFLAIAVLQIVSYWPNYTFPVNPAKRKEIFRRFRDANPHPGTELEHQTPFELIVSVVLSAQATDKSVNIATRELFKRANTPAAI